jgi:hypothetical protein
MSTIIICVVLLALVFPSTTFGYYTNMPASVVVGQPDFISSTANQGISRAANTLSGVRAVFVDSVGRLIVADTGNHRVLIWNRIPTSNNASADLVLGQADFVSGSANRGGSADSNTLSTPSGVFSDGNRLVVSDRGNHRALIWNTFPTQNGQSADVVVGQTSMTATATACTASGLNNPAEGVWIYNNKLILAVKQHRRVLIWNSIPTSNGASADVELGQTDMTTCSTTVGTTFNEPRGLTVDNNGRLYVVSDVHDRVLVWNSIPTTSGQSADLVIGQDNLTTTTAVTASANRFTLDQNNLATYGDRLYLPDRSSNRIVIFTFLPTANGVSADLVLGQSNFALIHQAVYLLQL